MQRSGRPSSAEPCGKPGDGNLKAAGEPGTRNLLPVAGAKRARGFEVLP